MRDAFGGTFLMYLMLIMVVVFVTFMTETLKYVQAYRVKNTIINYIEQYEGFNETVIRLLEGYEGTDGYLKKVGYSSNPPTRAPYSGYSRSFNEKSKNYCSKDYGYCVSREFCDDTIAYYKVTTNITLNFTEVLGITGIPVLVSGETRYVTLSGVTC